MSFQIVNEVTVPDPLKESAAVNNNFNLAKTWPSSIISNKTQIKNYPNSFTDATIIEYKLAVKSHVRLYT